MELCIFNLEEYLKIRNEPLSIDEIKEILFQLNKILKIMKEKNIIHKDLKLSNILISLEKINKIQIKLSDFGSSNKIKNETSLSKNETPLTKASEVLKN
jgi:serine/threonine-protein kinase ULK/ATG1